MRKDIFLDARLSANSGIGRYIDSLMDEFARNTDWGYRWSLAIGPEYQSNGIGECYTSRLNPFSPFWQLQAPFVLPAHKVFWTPHWNHPILLRSKVANVVTIHDVMPMRFPSLYSTLDRHLFSLFISTAVKRKYNIITVSEFSKREILDLYPSAIVEVIFNGTTALPVDPAESNASPPYLLCVGNWKPHKNISFAIRAFRLAKARSWISSNIKLIIAGKVHGLRQADASLLQTYGQDLDIEFVEHPSDSKLGRLYQDCLALISPSKYEGFGLPILEAMHFNKPIACSNIPPFREIAGDTVDYFNVDDVESCAAAIAQIVSPKAASERRYEPIVKRFTWAQSALAHHQLFSKLY